MEKNSNSLVVVLGMHRAGTSVITRSLAVLGIDPGNNPYPPTGDRPTGFWQDKDCLSINDELLEVLGSRYDGLGMAWGIDLDDPRIEKLYSRAIRLVSDRLVQNHGRWAVKDPRMCRLLTFWRKVFESCECEVSYIIALRNPLSVAESLEKRNQIHTDKGYLLWLQHMVPAVLDTREAPRIVVNYDDLLDHPEMQLTRIAKCLKIAFEAKNNAALASFSQDFLDNKLPHSRYSSSDFTSNRALPEDALKAYHLLIRIANDELSIDSSEVDLGFRQIQSNLQAYAPVLRYANYLEAEVERLMGLEFQKAQSVEPSTAPAKHDQQVVNLASEDEPNVGAAVEGSEMKSLISRDFQDVEKVQLIPVPSGHDEQIANLSGEEEQKPGEAADGGEMKPPGPDNQVRAKVPADSKPSGLRSLIHRIRVKLVPSNSRRARLLRRLITAATMENRGGFDPLFYLREYPDVLQAGMDPYQHYKQFGKAEGRLGSLNSLPEIKIEAGQVPFDETKEIVLVVCHEASRTGAPILGLNIVQHLRTKYNVISLLLGNGSILEDFREASTILAGPMPSATNPALAIYAIETVLKRYKIKFAIVNSIVSHTTLPVLAKNFVPTITLIHEFSECVRPRWVMMESVIWSNSVIFSAPVIHQNAVFDNPILANQPFQIIPQGRCALPFSASELASFAEEKARVLKALRPSGLSADTILVLGVGSVKLRKGVDLFIECAWRVKQASFGRNFRFVWIGEGYDPEDDLNYSMYLGDQIHRAELEEYVFFMKETANIEAAYKTADVLLISSRLDPLPNVGIDAMAHGLPLVCFEKTTGIADILIANGLGEECVAPYLDTVKMAAQVIAFGMDKAFSQEIGKKLRQIALKEFNMETYVSKLDQIALSSLDVTSQELADVLEITTSGLARPDFYLPPNSHILPDEMIRYYVRTWAIQLERRKLFPGFHPGIFLEQSGLPSSKGDPLANYLRAGQPVGPWRYEVITSHEKVRQLPSHARIALHLHIYYPDLLPEMLEKLNGNRVRPDLFISVPTASIRDEVKNLLLETYDGKAIEIQVVPNRGRDIGPFLTTFATTFVGQYDFVGHLHTKKTANFANASIGKNWHNFLMENMLGGKSTMADIILGHLGSDPSIGMVFADDPNAEPAVTGWGHNRPYAEKLGKQLGLENLPECILFPVGTMFWARVESLAPLFNLGLDWRDYPTEPLPYDGSELHALERLLPLVSSSQGFRSVVTNVIGITR